MGSLGAERGVVAVAGVVAGIIEGPERGWGDRLTVGLLVVGSVVGVRLVRRAALSRVRDQL